MAEINDILDERFLILAKLKKGRMGLVFKAIDTKMDKNKSRVIKEIYIRGMEPNEVLIFVDEINHLNSVKHLNILTFYGHFYYKGFLYTITEYCKDGDLEEFIKHCQKYQSFFSPNIVINYAEQLIKGLNHLHSHGIIHSDIKPPNIFIHESGLKIGNLDNCKKFELTQKSIAKGAECYHAPEFLNGAIAFSFESDIWSLAVTLYEICTLELPFKTPIQKVTDDVNFANFPKGYPTELVQAIQRMLSKNEKERPQTKELLIIFGKRTDSETHAVVTISRFKNCDDSLVINENTDNFSYYTHIKNAHDNCIRNLLLLPNGRLASASFDCSIKIWNTDDFSCFKHIKNAHDDSISCLVLLSDGTLASSSLCGSIKIWNKNDFSCLQHFKNLNDKWIRNLVLLPDGRLVGASDYFSINIWNTNDFSCFKKINKAHDKWISFLVLLPDGRLASASDDCSIKIWNTDGFSCFKHIKNAHEKWILCLFSLPDGRLVSASDDCSIKIWNINDSSFKHIENAHDKRISCLTLLKDGRLVSASGGFDTCSIKIWEANDFSSCKHIKNAHDNCIKSLALLSDGRLVSASDDRSIKIWNTKII